MKPIAQVALRVLPTKRETFRARARADAITLSAKFFTTIIFHYHD
jgi:hypothetical protein